MIAFIDDHREVHGVEPICKVLPIAPSTYHAHVAKRTDPERLSARAKRDMALKPEIARVFAENFEVYGVRKVWRQLQRESFDVARCTVERLMRGMGSRTLPECSPSPIQSTSLRFSLRQAGRHRASRSSIWSSTLPPAAGWKRLWFSRPKSGP
jgi:putative transposase